MLRLYDATHREMRVSVVPANLQPSEDFQEQRRRRISSDVKAKKPKPSEPTPEIREPRLCPKGEVPTRNIFAPLRSAVMDVESTIVQGTSDDPSSEPQELSAARQVGRAP
jgi:hypothetical protein